VSKNTRSKPNIKKPSTVNGLATIEVDLRARINDNSNLTSRKNTVYQYSID